MSRKESPIYVYRFWELGGLSPNFHIRVSMSDLYIPRIGLHFPAEQADRSWKYVNLSQIYEWRNWDTEHYNSVLEIKGSFLGIHNGNQTFILDSHRPFICSVDKKQTLKSDVPWIWIMRTLFPEFELYVCSEGVAVFNFHHGIGIPCKI